MEQMQNFHKSLSSSVETPSAQQRCLAPLTRLDRDQLTNLASEVVWFIWNEEELAPAN